MTNSNVNKDLEMLGDQKLLSNQLGNLNSHVKPNPALSDKIASQRSEALIEVNIFPDVIEEDFQDEQSPVYAVSNSDRHKPNLGK